jgi:hypothetical protein
MRSLVVLAGLSIGLAAGCAESSQPVAAVRTPGGEPMSQRELDPLPPEESAVVSGQVLAPEGRVLTDCFVEALLLPYFSSCGERVQVTGEGTFELSGLPAGQLFIEASAPGFATSSSAPFEAAAGTRVTDVVVRLSEGGALSGRVIDARADGIAGASVIAFDRFDFRDATCTARPRSQTDEDGRFTLQHVPLGHCSLEVEVAGYAVRIVDDISVEEGKTTDLHSVALCRGASISGAVLGLGGGPVRVRSAHRFRRALTRRASEARQRFFSMAFSMSASLRGAPQERHS